MKHVYIVLLITVVFLVTAQRSIVSSEVPEKPAYGDALIYGSIGEPSILIPMLAGDSSSHDVAGLVFNGLVKYDTDLSVIGDLAETWDISPDGLVTFHLKKGVKWSDGVEFTSDDVMFGYKTIIDEKTPTPYKEDYLQVKKAEASRHCPFGLMGDRTTPRVKREGRGEGKNQHNSYLILIRVRQRYSPAAKCSATTSVTTCVLMRLSDAVKAPRSMTS